MFRIVTGWGCNRDFMQDASISFSVSERESMYVSMSMSILECVNVSMLECVDALMLEREISAFFKFFLV